MSRLSIFDAAREAPHRPALWDGHDDLTFRELADRVSAHLERLAPLATENARERRSIRLVALSTEHPALAIELLLALFELGVTCLPLHARSSPKEREELCARVSASWSITTEHGSVELRRHDVSPSGVAASQAEPPLVAIATSGSTGQPRVALLSRRAMIAAARASAANLGWLPEDRWLLCLPLAHIGGLSIVTRCLLARRAVVLVREEHARSSAERLMEAIQIGRPSLISLVPAQLDALLADPKFVLPSSVRALLTGGAALSTRLLASCAERGWPVLTTYGLTEACSQVSTQPPGTQNLGQLGSGRPLAGVRVRINAGVIEIAGPTLFDGYLGADAGESGLDAEGWFRTSDWGHLDADGYLHVLGRRDDVIISGGENVSPREVEQALEACPGVLEACVFGVPDPRFGQVIAAALRCSPAAQVSLEAVAEHCRSKLATYKQPRLYAELEAFPRGPGGKLDRRETARAAEPLLRPVAKERSELRPPRVAS